MKEKTAIGMFCSIIILMLVTVVSIFGGLNLHIPGQGGGMLNLLYGNEDSGYVLYKQPYKK